MSEHAGVVNIVQRTLIKNIAKRAKRKFERKERLNIENGKRRSGKVKLDIAKSNPAGMNLKRTFLIEAQAVY